MMRRKPLKLIAALLIAGAGAHAQTPDNARPQGAYQPAEAPALPSGPPTPPPAPAAESRAWALGLGGSATWYAGDLAATAPQAGLHLSLQRLSARRITLRLQAGLAASTGQDPALARSPSYTGNTYFKSRLGYVNLLVHVKILKSTRLRPYAGLGVGALFFAPQDAQSTPLIDQPDTRAPGETYGGGAAFFPLALGAELPVSPRLTLGLEYAHLFLATDYLDNIAELGGQTGADALHQLRLVAYFRLGR